MNVATEKQVQIIRPLAEYSDNARIQRVAAYCRVSTDSDDQVNSFLNQVRYYTDFIRTSDKMELVDIYADEGITGTSLNKRDDFKRMLNDARLGKIDRIYVNKDGLGVIRANFFIDASGDGDLCRDVGLKSYMSSAVQPPSPGCFLNGKVKNMYELILGHGGEFGLEDDWGWGGKVPGLEGIFFRADFHIFGKMCNRTDDLTEAEIEGRRKIYALTSLLKKYEDPGLAVVALCSQIGIRETVHFETRFRANELDLLLGTSYEDTVMRGTYRVDVHHQHDNGITFKYLNGEVETFYGKSNKTVRGNWREDNGISSPPARYYQIPFEILVQDKMENLIPVGRMINADDGAFGALRVMVNLNQLGEAAGVAAYLSLDAGMSVSKVCGKKVQDVLRKGGSV